MLRVFEPHITDEDKNQFQMRFLRAGFRQQDLILKNLRKLFAQLSVSHMQFP